MPRSDDVIAKTLSPSLLMPSDRTRRQAYLFLIAADAADTVVVSESTNAPFDTKSSGASSWQS
eukprot:3396496-Rhodomonas_salina.1